MVSAISDARRGRYNTYRLKVRDVIKMIEEDGWYLVGTKGSHRQYRHSSKPGRVTVPGHLGDDLAPGNTEQCFQAGRLKRKS